MINGIGGSSAGNYNSYYSGTQNSSASGAVGATGAVGAIGTSAGSVSRNIAVNSSGVTNSVNDTEPDGAELRALKKSGAVECATCASRKYQDGSNENVSFKSAAHIDPSASGAKVMAHEQEHVSNAYNKASQDNGKVINASVSLKTAICPECGSSYVAGGTTNTMIRYNESNQYGSNKKSADYAALAGMNVDLAV